jgi:hypothetical protein
MHRRVIMRPPKKPNTPLMWKISHPDTPYCSYLFATYAKLKPNEVAYISKKVANSKEFQQAQIFIIEQAHLVNAPKKAMGFFKDTTVAKSNQTTHSEKQLKQEGALAKTIAIKCKNTITQTLYEVAKKLNKPTYPLDTPTRLKWHKASLYARRMTKPTNIAKAIALMATFPLGPIIYYKQLYKQDKAYGEIFRRQYMQRDLLPAMDKLYEYPILRDELINKRNWQWLYQGYDGKKDVPTQLPLKELIKKANCFITITAGHVFDKDYNLIRLLERHDFTVKAVYDWDKTPSQEDVNQNTSELSQFSLIR